MAQAFIIGESFIGTDSATLILGDNIFDGSGFGKLIRQHNNSNGAVIFASYINGPQRYGVVEFDNSSGAVSLEEKPTDAKSNFAVPSLNFYDNQVVEITKSIQLSRASNIKSRPSTTNT